MCLEELAAPRILMARLELKYALYTDSSEKDIKQQLEYFQGVQGLKVQMYFRGAKNLKVQKYFLEVGDLVVQKYLHQVDELRVEYDRENTSHIWWMFLGLQGYIVDNSNGQYDSYF